MGWRVYQLEPAPPPPDLPPPKEPELFLRRLLPDELPPEEELPKGSVL
ncbi:hypothetical protein [Lujinxingia vulgaris]|nr:hypothetical protein [Lujinxingia vulgaris]